MGIKSWEEFKVLRSKSLLSEVDRRIPPVYKGFAVEILATEPITAEEPG
jgi:hypothetical protein